MKCKGVWAQVSLVLVSPNAGVIAKDREGRAGRAQDQAFLNFLLTSNLETFQAHQSKAAKYFGETSPNDLKNLERTAVRANTEQMAKAASYLEQALRGMETAWFGGCALNLRGSLRQTHDLDFLVLVPSLIRLGLFWPSTVGELNTPNLGLEGSFETNRPSFETPQGKQVKVIELAWQVEGKLITWFSRRKHSDFLDLVFLLLKYDNKISKWSENLNKDMRVAFYDIYDADTEDETMCKAMKKRLSL
ncbi:hypothetical protein AJ80_03422 [Polytolypa hystricis UAMH7299]|uniref:Polymerase nucleotidyl transferase domain-containing protein n=1 Tax=Polytolypa hystricis (strain UAMH7299) TaxID=1447883 RepID=A0A2B7YHM9_POLH7|nr:hypothetical protein AJ80_03422 [Polytolypa hystricis UAMH7299]